MSDISTCRSNELSDSGAYPHKMKTDVFRYALSIPELRSINANTKNNAESKGNGERGKGKGNLRIKCMGAGRIPAKKHIHRQEKLPSSGTLTNNTYMLWQSVTPTGSYVLSTSIDRSIPLSAVPSLGGGKVKIQFPFPLYPFPFHLSSP